MRKGKWEWGKADVVGKVLGRSSRVTQRGAVSKREMAVGIGRSSQFGECVEASSR
jgi:hypothetical protein